MQTTKTYSQCIQNSPNFPIIEPVFKAINPNGFYQAKFQSKLLVRKNTGKVITFVTITKKKNVFGAVKVVLILQAKI
tara:strand:- start:283 stop:513 length:231 start_codon:yes stop_codon:yes gene_type:complete